MSYHKLVVGIEHLMTGISIGTRPGESNELGVLTFRRESPSTIGVYSTQPIVAYWDATQSDVQSTEVEEIPEPELGEGSAEWYAKVMAPAMNKTDNAAIENYVAHQGLWINNPPLPPWAVVAAMRRKHGAEADQYISALRWDGLMGCWFYTYKGMLLGVERDGYIHT